MRWLRWPNRERLSATLKKAKAPKPYRGLFYEAFNASPVGIALENLEGQPLFANPALCSMLGFSEEELRSKHCVEFSPPEDAKKDWALFEQLRAGSISHYQIDKRFLRRDGSLIWGRLSISLLNHRVSPLVVALVEDITEKKATEEELLRAQEEERQRVAREQRALETLELVTKQMAAAVVCCSRDLRYLWANQGYANLVQRPLDEITCRPMSEVMGKETFEILRPHIERVLRGEKVKYEEELNYPRIGRRWISAAYTPTLGPDKVANGWVAVLVDVTERKLAEHKLQEYERAVEGLEEMITVVDREYRYLIANNKFLKMRNMTKEQVVGRFAHEVLNKGVFETVFKQKVDECFQGKVVRYEMKYTYPQLGERDIRISYFPIEGATGVDRVACVAEDITERKAAEGALSTVSQRLIEAQEEERSRLARELHDDINQRITLLAASLGQLKKGLRPEETKIGQQLDEAYDWIVDLGNDIQALSHRLHSPKLELLGLAATARGFCSELSGQQGVQIDFCSENVPQELSAEIALCLFRVLQEALNNAVKHSGSQQFEVLLKGGADEIELTVQDSGVGFELAEAVKGRGLGLTSMKERLKLVDGQLCIDSKPHRGTTIHASVPLSPRTRSATAAG